MKDLKGGYVMIDAKGLDLTTGSTPVTIAGIWDVTVAALKANKPIVAYNLKYSTAAVSPVACFGWYLGSTEIVLVSATIHVHVHKDNTVTTLDVVGS